MHGPVILGYHGVSASPQVDPLGRGLRVAAARFRQHMSITARRFTIVPLDDLVGRLSEGADGTAGMAAVTFDDGYEDNYLHAFPILTQMGVPVTVFLTTDNIEHGRSFWTERLAGYLCGAAGGVVALPAELGGPVNLTSPGSLRPTYREVRGKLSALEDAGRREQLLDALGAAAPIDRGPLSWQQVRIMHRQGVAFGAHTRSHPSLMSLSDAAARAEIEASRDLIRTRLGSLSTVFAYPFGDAEVRIGRIVEAAGFRAAVTVLAGRCGPDSPPFFLPRLIVGDWAPPDFARRLEAAASDSPLPAPQGRSVASALRAAIPRPVAAVLRSIRSRWRSTSPIRPCP